jgi:RNA polymerase sigma-70 factor (ECF subfamily)
MDIEEQYDKVYRYCYYKVHTQEIAEDITQETFLRYFNQTTYLDRGKPLAYLCTIARNLCNDYFTRKMTEPLEDMVCWVPMEQAKPL